MGTATKALRLMEKSSQPQQELTIALGSLIATSKAYEKIVHQKRPILSKIFSSDKVERMQCYEKIIGCNIMISRLYLAQRNQLPALECAKEAKEAFEAYADIKKEILVNEIKQTYMHFELLFEGVGVGYWYYDEHKRAELNELKELYHTRDEEVVFQKLAEKELNQERKKLFLCLKSLELS